jgi:hypothetical protein
MPLTFVSEFSELITSLSSPRNRGVSVFTGPELIVTRTIGPSRFSTINDDDDDDEDTDDDRNRHWRLFSFNCSNLLQNPARSISPLARSTQSSRPCCAVNSVPGSPNRITASTFGDTPSDCFDCDADCGADRDAYGQFSDCFSDCDANGNSDCDADRDAHGHSDCDAYGHSDICDADCDANGHSDLDANFRDANGHSDCDAFPAKGSGWLLFPRRKRVMRRA